MTHLSGDCLIPRGHRLFEPMQNLLVVIDAICTSIGIMMARRAPGPGDTVACWSDQFKTQVLLPIGGPLQSVITGKQPELIQIAFANDIGGPPSKKPPQAANFGPDVYINVISPIFVAFFEQHKPWIRRNHGGADAYQWPMIFNFCRCVRNWVAHHHGRVHFDNPNAAPVTWHHLSYSPADAGRKAVGVDLEFGDLVILLFEFSEELDRLGCPQDP